MNTEDKKTDDLFKSAFENFEATPTQQNQEEAAEELNKELDEDFRAQLQPLKVTPQVHIWDCIQEELPLHSGMRRYFSWMNKIAVVLVIGMLLSILSDQNRQLVADQTKCPENTALTTVLRDPSNNTLLPAAKNSAFVFDVTKRSTSLKHPRRFSEQEEAYIKLLLQFILDDNDELAILTDSTIIRNSLSPAMPSYSEEALAQANQDAKQDLPELQISIPLIVVENEAEAERLIQIYDSNHASSRAIEE
jgi:hypothetical protein